MEGISDIKIVGIDDKRPPVIRKSPYIDIYFKLSHKAPEDWCNDFNALLSKLYNSPKINQKEGLYIEVWVRKADEIVAMLDLLKEKVEECSKKYIERVELLTKNALEENAALAKNNVGEQGHLNRIISSLEFDDILQ